MIRDVEAIETAAQQTYFSGLTGSVTTLLTLTPQIGKGLESARSIGEVLQAPDLEQNDGKAAVSGGGCPAGRSSASPSPGR